MSTNQLLLKMKAFETAIEKWKREGVRLLPPLEPAVVAEKLSVLGRPCSRDVLALYAITGGMRNGESDSHFWSFWSLERVISENVRSSRPDILFADFLIDSHCYCLKYENAEQSSVAIDYLNGEEPESVAGSIEEFFQIFNSDAAKLKMFE